MSVRVAAIASGQLDCPVNRKRVQRVMCAHGLLHRATTAGRCPVARISRQALYRPIATRPAAAGPGRGRAGDHPGPVRRVRLGDLDDLVVVLRPSARSSW